MQIGKRFFKTYPLYGSAYLNLKTLDAHKTHTVEVTETDTLIRVLCGKVKLDNVCEVDDNLGQIPTCGTCAKRLEKIKKESET